MDQPALASPKINGNGHTYENQDCDFLPGTFVPRSGLYEICHADENRATVVFRKDEIFPVCLQCGERVRYKLLHAAPHISEDPDFAHPGEDPDLPPGETARGFPRQLGAAYGFRFWQSPL